MFQSAYCVFGKLECCCNGVEGVCFWGFDVGGVWKVMLCVQIQCIEVDVHPQICVVVEVAVCGGGRWCLWLEVGMIVEEDRLEVVATEEGLGKRIRVKIFLIINNF